MCMGGLPWWRSGWEPAYQCRGHRFELWSGKIPHAAEQPGPWATTAQPARLEPVLRSKRGCDSERPAHRDEEWPRLPQLEKALAQKRRPNTAKNKLKKKKKKKFSASFLVLSTEQSLLSLFYSTVISHVLYHEWQATQLHQTVELHRWKVQLTKETLDFF